MTEGREFFRTPNGNRIEMFFRDGTNDRGVIESITTDDEYHIPTHYEGVGVDVGAHIGTWAITVAKDNPGLAVVAIEALLENCQMMQRNVSLNGLEKRIKVLHRAASSSNHPVAIRYAFRGDENALIHRYIGDQRSEMGKDHEVQHVQGLRLTRLARMIGEPIRILKIDCEGCEWKFFKSQAIGRVTEIIGEYHFPSDIDIKTLLEATHDVEIVHDDGGLGMFRAVRR